MCMYIYIYIIMYIIYNNNLHKILYIYIPLYNIYIIIYILCKLPIFRPHDGKITRDLTSPPCPSAHRLSHDGGEWIHGPTQRHPVRCFDWYSRDNSGFLPIKIMCLILFLQKKVRTEDTWKQRDLNGYILPRNHFLKHQVEVGAPANLSRNLSQNCG